MKIPQASLNSINQQKNDREVPEEMKKAAEGLESVFASQMLKAMRQTIEPSEFSLHNSATDIYQGMLDQEYSDIAAHTNSLGLSEQIIDYWLRESKDPRYNQEKGAAQHSGKNTGRNSAMSTGGTHEDKSNKRSVK